MSVNIMWNRTEKNRENGRMETADSGFSIGQRIMDSVHSMQGEGGTDESQRRYAARIRARLQAGKRLTPAEMSFLARTDPALYQKALRVQSMRRNLERQLKCCHSKQEAEAVFSASVQSVSEDDPDRDMILAAFRQAYLEFTQSPEYEKLPEREEDGKDKTGADGLEFGRNEEGYQEVYIVEKGKNPFAAKV